MGKLRASISAPSSDCVPRILVAVPPWDALVGRLARRETGEVRLKACSLNA